MQIWGEMQVFHQAPDSRDRRAWVTDSPGRPQRGREGGKSDACSSLVQTGASLVGQTGASLVGHEINLVRGSQN